MEAGDGVEREIWLWDFGGQSDQRLIHQLYMDGTALAALVFDGQKEDLFDPLGQWDRDITRASRKEFTKLLVAGRVDTGGLRANKGQVEAFARDHGFTGRLLETSAKTGDGCVELKEAIQRGIRWENMPQHSSPKRFKWLKDEIIRLKDAGRVLMRFNELRDLLRLRLAGEGSAFKDDDQKATGEKLYLQLKSGDSYLRERKSDGAEIFTLRNERHVRYWMAQAFPVLLVIRNSEGEIRWMEVRDYLKRESDNGQEPVKQIIFTGERFDVMSVRRWRDRALRGDK